MRKWSTIIRKYQRFWTEYQRLFGFINDSEQVINDYSDISTILLSNEYFVSVIVALLQHLIQFQIKGRMDMEYKQYTNIPESWVMDGILTIHQEIFEDATLPEKAEAKKNILFLVAIDHERIAGYKIGYELSDDTFYSWYGAVHPDYRGQGIAGELMRRQHSYLKEAGYHTVQTKTRNKWREMLILNIRHGFDVIETFVDGEGIHRIVLEKKL